MYGAPDIFSFIIVTLDCSLIRHQIDGYSPGTTYFVYCHADHSFTNGGFSVDIPFSLVRHVGNVFLVYLLTQCFELLPFQLLISYCFQVPFRYIGMAPYTFDSLHPSCNNSCLHLHTLAITPDQSSFP